MIVGGVAGGASCAARLRRLDEDADIVVYDRGPHVSFANCGLPYFVGDVIRDEADLLVATPDLFRTRFRIDVQVMTEVTAIDPARQTIQVRHGPSDSTRTEPYDALVLSPGADAVRPPVSGIDLPGIFTVRTIPDSHRIRTWLSEHRATKAVVIGGGFIGLEMAENLSHRGLEVALVEMAPHVMAPLDAEMAWLVEEQLRQRIELHLNEAVSGFERAGEDRLLVRTRSGAQLTADIVIVAVGLKPNVELARAAGLAIGDRGGIRVDRQMRTSAPNVWAVGDAIEVHETVTGVESMLPLAGPANRQGRVAADAICGRPTRFRGVQGTAVVGCFGLTAACTGANERTLRKLNFERGGRDHRGYQAIYLHPGHHVGYYPGAKPIHMKLIFRPSDGRVLGAQAIGEEGAARRVDVISSIIQLGGTVFDLEEAELCYAPQFGAAKDPVNLAGMIAANVVRGDLAVDSWETLADGLPDGVTVIDVRRPDEAAQGMIHGALNIPLEHLRERIPEIPTDGTLAVYCAVGQRAYYAARLLMQRGFQVRNVSGGFKTAVAYPGIALSKKQPPRD